jgi:hypothetical protein
MHIITKPDTAKQVLYINIIYNYLILVYLIIIVYFLPFPQFIISVVANSVYLFSSIH